jgi:hypothetical protein
MAQRINAFVEVSRIGSPTGKSLVGTYPRNARDALKINFGADGGSRSTVRPARGNGDAVLKAAMHSFEAFDRRVALFHNDWQSQGGGRCHSVVIFFRHPARSRSSPQDVLDGALRRLSAPRTQGVGQATPSRSCYAVKICARILQRNAPPLHSAPRSPTLQRVPDRCRWHQAWLPHTECCAGCKVRQNSTERPQALRWSMRFGVPIHPLVHRLANNGDSLSEQRVSRGPWAIPTPSLFAGGAKSGRLCPVLLPKYQKSN